MFLISILILSLKSRNTHLTKDILSNYIGFSLYGFQMYPTVDLWSGFQWSTFFLWVTISGKQNFLILMKSDVPDGQWLLVCQVFGVCLWQRKGEVGATTVIIKANLRWEECPWAVGMLSWVKCLLLEQEDLSSDTKHLVKVRGGGKCCVGQRQADPWSLLTSQFSQLVSSGFSERPCLNKVESEDTWCQPLVSIQLAHINYTHIHSLSHKRTILFFFF